MVDCQGRFYNCINSTHFYSCEYDYDNDDYSRTVEIKGKLRSCRPGAYCSNKDDFECNSKVETEQEFSTIKFEPTTESSTSTLSEGTSTARTGE